jgi:uncharacterized membrane protein (DUF485 family)
MYNYFHSIYKILFEPNSAFEELKQNPSTSLALITIIWVNIFLYTINYSFNPYFLNNFFIPNITIFLYNFNFSIMVHSGLVL